MSDFSIELRSSHNLKKLALAYKQAGRLQVRDLLEMQCARRLHEEIHAFRDWSIHLNQGDKAFDVTAEQRAAMLPAQVAALKDAARAGAQQGFQYHFESFPIYDAYHSGCCPEPFMEQTYEFLNSESFLAFTRTLTGHSDIGFADAQLTRYTPGDFLTVHDDGIEGKNRRAAYVINLTPDWRADFGGLLQFFAENGNIAEAYTPSFNTLSIFSVPAEHSVSEVASFAPRARYAITGWLRAGSDPALSA